SLPSNVLGRSICVSARDLRALPFQNVDDLGSVAGSNAIRFATVNRLDCDANSRSILGWLDNFRHVTFQSAFPRPGLDVDHLDHAVHLNSQTPSDAVAVIHRSWNATVMVMTTGTGSPLSNVGVKRHCRTASTAAASSNGFERSTRTSRTEPSSAITASRMTR